MGCRSHISRSGEGCSWMTLETKDSSSQTDDPRHTDVGTQCSMLTTTSNLPSLPPLPRSSRLCPKCRCLIARVHEIRKLQDIDGDNLSSTAANLGVSRRTVRLCLERYGPIYRYQADRVRSGEVPSPANKLPACRKSKRCLNRRELCNQVRNSIPIFVQQKLREVMHSFYKQNLPPTLASVLTIMRGCLGEDFDYGKEHLRMLLRGIGFKFQVVGDQAICFERTDICRWRGWYVRRMAQLRAEGYSLFFSDETWLFEGMQLARQWVDTVTAANPLQSLSEGLTAGPSRAPSKGKRVVIIHTMGEDGFVDGALKFIISGRSVADGDYHGEMNAETFEAYLKAILPLLKKSREDKVALIIDNAPYHSRKVEGVPTRRSKKDSILSFLERNGIECDVSWKKSHLLACVDDLVRGKEKEFERKAADEICRESEVLLVRLPPYHCDLSPIEKGWGWVKHQIAARIGLHNTLEGIINLAQQVFHEMPAEIARSYFCGCQNLEKHYYDIDSEGSQATRIEFSRDEAGESGDESFSESSCDEEDEDSDLPFEF